ncbi:hypothetical protein EMCG_08795 [[Emmonsia] crescens]|uniref:Mid2 domain-containing protein n=1 Tax=[Emmonsia] crescens TaxID=73230 RepID=A0A0G2JAA2_9EURO|nr:hypothetical protein EMCG_08795 [Emmonsia crescens UAMH 3008]
MRWTPTFSLLLLSALLLAIAVAGTEENGRKRQVISVDDPAPSESETPTVEPSSTPSTTTSPTETTTTTETPTEPTSKPSDPPPSTTPTDKPPQTPGPTTASPTKTKTPPPQSSVIIITNTITVGGSVIEQTSASTIAPGQTPAPGLGKEGGGSNGSSGLSDSSKKTIIGVVVGVGGAVILGGLAFVAWRLRRKRNARGLNDDDDLMNAGTAVGSSSHETSTMGNTPSPFKATLDQYHHPGGVNPSSNF